MIRLLSRLPAACVQVSLQTDTPDGSSPSETVQKRAEMLKNSGFGRFLSNFSGPGHLAHGAWSVPASLYIHKSLSQCPLTLTRAGLARRAQLGGNDNSGAYSQSGHPTTLSPEPEALVHLAVGPPARTPGSECIPDLSTEEASRVGCGAVHPSSPSTVGYGSWEVPRRALWHT